VERCFFVQVKNGSSDRRETLGPAVKKSIVVYIDGDNAGVLANVRVVVNSLLKITKKSRITPSRSRFQGDPTSAVGSYLPPLKESVPKKTIDLSFDVNGSTSTSGKVAAAFYHCMGTVGAV